MTIKIERAFSNGFLDEIQRGIGRVRAFLIAALLLATVTGCTITVVTPYDEGLSNGITDFQEDASAMLQELESKGASAAYSNYEERYQKLIASLDALFTRSMANARQVDDIGRDIQELLNQGISDATGGNREDYENLSLTAANIFDLRTLVQKWQANHKAGSSSSVVWSQRRTQLARTIYAILSLEQAKRTDGEN